MDNESIYGLQKLDSNCNNCKFMIRDMDKHKKSLDDHHRWQFDYFTTIKNKLIENAKKAKKLYYDLEKFDSLLTEAEAMKFQFDKKEALINYGRCDKFNKDVSFIPNVCQLETQKCFVHRKD